MSAYRKSMGIEGIGSSVVIALAAVLWLVYLIPTWFRRREYLSTERNAIRLQQTLRIMAETAEVPEPVHVESSARGIAAQQRRLRLEIQRKQAIERAREEAMKRAATRTLATLKPAIASAVVTHSRAAKRLRRARATTSAVLLLAVATTAAGLTPSAASISGLLLAAGSATAALCVGLLSWMAAVGRERARVARELRARAQQTRVAPEPVEVAPVAAGRAWTPVPLPRPLYLSKPPLQTAVSEAALAEARQRILIEAAAAERARVLEEQAEKVTPIVRPAASESRFARMGIVDDTARGVTDLDAALRRRRAV